MAKQRTDISGDDAYYVIYLAVIWLILSVMITSLAYQS